MKHLTLLVLCSSLVGVAVQPGFLLAQTTNVRSLTVPLNASVSAPSPASIAPVATTNVSAVRKCGVNTYSVANECGVGAFKNMYVQCYDGYEEKQGETSSCKSSEVWQEYARAVCASRCGAAATPPVPSAVTNGKPLLQVMPRPMAEPMPTTATLVAVCTMSDDLMGQYNSLITELQKAETSGNETEAGEVIPKIIALKQEIAKDQERCRTKVSPTKPQPTGATVPTVVSQGTITIDRCTEVKQWEEKTNYYKKISGLGDADLKSEYGFSREEVNRIVQELGTGVEKVRVQCVTQSTLTAPQVGKTIAVSQASQAVTEQVKPVAVQSAAEINGYYKVKLQTITGAATTAESQIQQLKVLQGEKDALTEQLIKSRKEIEATELNALEKEVTVTSGRIRAGDVTVDTTGKKVLINVGATPVSVEPTAGGVIIREKMEIKIDGVSIENNKLKVGQTEVKLLASDVADKLGIVSTAAELKEENAKAVYKLKTDEPRKLFGFIPVTISNTLTADAGDGSLIKKESPWYSFLTTK
ncbi:MAG: hypothetical protein V1656_01535 [Candidatus Jorgensenbacteria bacterium]